MIPTTIPVNWRFVFLSPNIRIPPSVEIIIPICDSEKLVATPTRGCEMNKNIFPAAQINPGIIFRIAYLLNG